MGGGRFDYMEHHIETIAEDIKEEWLRQGNPPLWWDKQSNGEWNVNNDYKEKTYRMLKEAWIINKLAYIYDKAVDYLIEDDYGEKDFEEHIKKGIKELVEEMSSIDDSVITELSKKLKEQYEDSKL